MESLFGSMKTRFENIQILEHANIKQIKKDENLRQIVENSIFDNFNQNKMNFTNFENLYEQCYNIMNKICPTFILQQKKQIQIEDIALLFIKYFTKIDQENKSDQIQDFINQKCPKASLLILLLRWLIQSQRDLLKQQIKQLYQKPVDKSEEQTTNLKRFPSVPKLKYSNVEKNSLIYIYSIDNQNQNIISKYGQQNAELESERFLRKSFKEKEEQLSFRKVNVKKQHLSELQLNFKIKEKIKIENQPIKSDINPIKSKNTLQPIKPKKLSFLGYLKIITQIINDIDVNDLIKKKYQINKDDLIKNNIIFKQLSNQNNMINQKIQIYILKQKQRKAYGKHNSEQQILPRMKKMKKLECLSYYQKK